MGDTYTNLVEIMDLARRGKMLNLPRHLSECLHLTTEEVLRYAKEQGDVQQQGLPQPQGEPYCKT